MPVISIAARLWDWRDMPRRDEAKRAVDNAVERLEPVKAYLAALVKQNAREAVMTRSAPSA